MNQDAPVGVFAGDPRASTARALWKAREAATTELYDEVQTMQHEGYMIGEIARVLGVDRQTLSSLLSAETTRRRYAI